ncbi:iron-siderophore ABC transporter permease [Kitasatospora cheerisanensis KCTC 2395]|uniref:Iron-siderophore ABC transporter permease n=1 Tax=Kitasatospora cheerisanensis KCTC 2395 TaxID=1348663 RepID=A0A066YSQ8_9ACTN|nr:iron-siderophore ABC transporter permease [Kitasatospora cheerisanensis KCTC 2395]
MLPVHGLPVGAVTATLGAPWLLALMVRQGRLPQRSSR